ncbi:MAG TPA: MFS transporter [Gaiellaceae bacterium]|nr:MFS transporter [Gaiellaceae bacterium]
MSLWTAATASQLGSQVSLLALPFVAIATLKATTFEVAALGVVDFAPLLLFSLPAGVWIDRIPRRPVMVLADSGRAVALASIPVAYAMGVLTIWQFFVAGFVTGTLTVFFDVNSDPPRNRRTRGARAGERAAADLEPEHAGGGTRSCRRAHRIARCAVCGGRRRDQLRCVCGVPIARPCDGAAASAQPAADARGHSRRASIHPPASDNAPESRVLATANFFNSVLFSVLLLFAVRKLGLSARQVGLIFTLSNVGSLLAALATSRLQRRFGYGRLMLVTAFSGWALLLIPFAHGSTRIPFLVAGLVSFGSGAVIFNASSATIRQATTPDYLLARVAASNRLVAWGTIPVATLLGGILGTYFGLRTAVLTGAVGRTLAGLIIFASPVRNVRTLDDADALVAPFNESLGEPGPVV